MQISDSALCNKKLDVDQTNFLPAAPGAGTVGWRAPEISRRRMVAIHLGTTEGWRGRETFFRMEGLGDKGSEAPIKQMLDRVPRKRYGLYDLFFG